MRPLDGKEVGHRSRPARRRAFLAAYLPACRITYLDVHRVPSEHLRQQRTAGAWGLRLIQIEAELDPDRFAAQYQEVAEGLASLPARQSAACRCVLWSVLVMAARRPSAEYGRLDAILREAISHSPIARRRAEVTDMRQTMLDVWKEEGKAEGRMEGRMEGQVERDRAWQSRVQEMVLRAIGVRFGPVVAEVDTLIRGLSDQEHLVAAFDAALQEHDERALVTRLRALRNVNAA